MAEFEETVRLIESAYKNILDKFNPCARQLISAGRTYLKALHGAVAASKGYTDAISRLARHAHQATWGGCTDIGTALMQLVDVQKEIEAQQMNILKAFYVDLLVPLEKNIEKDAKVVASEQKKFLQQHKAQQEAYLKVAAVVKKQHKKRRGGNLDKDMKQMQMLQEEKGKLDGFCESSLKQAITQERRRFGFVLERQCSLAKHYLAFHAKGHALLQCNVDNWQEVIQMREILPDSMRKIFSAELRFPQISEYASPGILSDPESARLSSVFMRKIRSTDASCIDLRSLAVDARPLSRAKSDLNLAPSTASVDSAEYAMKDDQAERHVQALYSYLSNGEHQLSFHEGDIIELVGNRNKGWQYGVNLRNHRSGWFPIAYTEPQETSDFDSSVSSDAALSSTGVCWRTKSGDIGSYNACLPSSPAPHRPMSSFADTYLFRRQSREERSALPGSELPQVACGTLATIHPLYHHPQSILRPPRRSLTSPLPFPLPPPRLPPSASLHSSSDSGFYNDSQPGGAPLAEVESVEMLPDDVTEDGSFSSVDK
ncbi:brain-specific angiogenesis inhibitor 1-associated protein 2-like isoform X2 [Ornithodoros turicata]|uniref:brain-specific angiogenesis inhibitor 1-associated protein 2-like isoform X2 n=1 Tax=Ornithodoros turicata TaxID=34597 RepID=UPI003138D15D